MAIAQLAPIAKDFKIADSPVDIMGLVLPALTFALAIDRVLNGLTRPFFGWVSDQIGRELTMFIAFGLEAVGILALYMFGQAPVAFVILTGLVFFAWGEIYSLFPSTCADTFGSKYAAANAGHALHGQGNGLAAGAAVQRVGAATGSWHSVFIVASLHECVAALMAWFVLRPMRRAQMDRSAENRGARASHEGTWPPARTCGGLVLSERCQILPRCFSRLSVSADRFRKAASSFFGITARPVRDACARSGAPAPAHPADAA